MTRCFPPHGSRAPCVHSTPTQQVAAFVAHVDPTWRGKNMKAWTATMIWSPVRLPQKNLATMMAPIPGSRWWRHQAIRPSGRLFFASHAWTICVREFQRQKSYALSEFPRAKRCPAPGGLPMADECNGPMWQARDLSCSVVRCLFGQNCHRP